MFTYKTIPSLKKHVLTRPDKDEKALAAAAATWMEVAQVNKLAWEIEWLGVPIIQSPEDIVLMQELLFAQQPDVIIETGIAHGGALIFYASLCELFGRGAVIGIDVEIRAHNRKVIEGHPLAHRITLLEGDSVAIDTVSKVRSMVPADAKILVCHDSNHTRAHVLKELRAYQSFIRPGGYIVVFDTHSSDLAKRGACPPEFIDNGPMEAIRDFLHETKDFEIDLHYNRLYTSTSPNGYLKRVR